MTAGYDKYNRYGMCEFGRQRAAGQVDYETKDWHMANCTMTPDEWQQHVIKADVHCPYKECEKVVSNISTHLIAIHNDWSDRSSHEAKAAEQIG